METELTWTYSSANLTDFSHVFNTLTEPTVIEQAFKWTSVEIGRILQIIIRPILIVVGTTGNCLTFYIMRRSSLKDVSSCFYMSLLALADTSESSSCLGKRYIESVPFFLESTFFCLCNL